jgi:atypical dual specificity phosphatase
LVLLDEPNRRVDPTKLAELEGAIEHRARSAAIVIVTHDLAFARRIGDHVCLIAAGRPLALQSAEDFFESPASESAAHFIREGNCWPERYAPTLPNHFCWVLEGQLGGMAYPGMLSDENEELEAIAQAGIEVLVSTTVDAFPREKLRPFGIEGRHLPIKDMDVPAVRTTASICAGMKRAIDAGRGVAVHCRAGLGRTGLLVASYLVWDGRSAAEAIEAVRRVNARYIQTTSQEKFIRQFAETIGR